MILHWRLRSDSCLFVVDVCSLEALLLVRPVCLDYSKDPDLPDIKQIGTHSILFEKAP